MTTHAQNIANVDRYNRYAQSAIAAEMNKPDSWVHEQRILAEVKALTGMMGEAEFDRWMEASGFLPAWTKARQARFLEEAVARFGACRHEFITEHGHDGSGEPDGDIELVYCPRCGLYASDEYLARWHERLAGEAKTNAALAAKVYQR